jgi:hypothetical protein
MRRGIIPPTIDPGEAGQTTAGAAKRPHESQRSEQRGSPGAGLLAGGRVDGRQ